VNAKISQPTTSSFANAFLNAFLSMKVKRPNEAIIFHRALIFLFSILFFQRTYLYPASADDNHNPSFQNDCSKGRKEKYEEIFFLERILSGR